MQRRRRALRASPALRPLAVAAAIALGLGSPHAAQVTWVGADGGFWDVAADWSPALPGSLDDLTLGAFDTVVRSNFTVNSFAGTGTLSLAIGTLSFAAASSTGGLAMSGGTLTGAGNLTVAKASTWSDGLMSGTGVTTFEGDLAITGTDVHDVSGRTVNFNGTTTWTGDSGNVGRFRTGSSALLNNNGTWLDKTTANTRFSNDYGGPTGTFTNNGSYIKSGATDTAFYIAFDSTSGGKVRVDAGTLSLGGAGTALGGNVSVASGATLEFFTGTSTVSGLTASGSAGTLLVDGGTVETSGSSSFGGRVSVSGGTLSVADTFQAGSLNQSGGAVAGTGTLDVAGASTWSDGLESGTGVTNFNGALAITGADVHDVSGRTVNFNGTTTWTGDSGNVGRFRTGSSALLNNNGTWLDKTTANTRFSNDYGGAVATFTNNGSYIKSGATDTAFYIAFDSTSGGKLQVDAGTLSLGGAGTALGGNVSVASGATLEFFSGTSTLNGLTASGSAGTLLVDGGTVETSGSSSFGGRVSVSGGTLSVADTFQAGSLNQSGGAVSGTGTLDVAGASTWSDGLESGTGVTNFNGALALTGNVVHDVSERTVDFNGTTTWTNTAGNAGRFRTGSAAALNDNGTWLDQTTVDTRFTNDYGGAVATFTNNGSYIKSGATDTAFYIAFDSTSGGKLQVDAGTLSLGGAGTALGGNVSVASGATLEFFSGTSTVSGLAAAGSAGTLLVDGGTVETSGSSSFGGRVSVSGGTLSVADTFQAGSLNQSGGAVSGTGTLDVAGASTWSDGLESGTGVTNFNGALALTGNVVHDVSERTVDFNGTTTWTNTAGNAGRFRTGSAAALNNNGTWLDQTTVDTRFTNDYGGAVATFTNNGSYIKSGATDTAFYIAFDSTSGGKLQVDAGTLSLGGAGTALGGNVSVASGATLEFFSGTSTVSGLAAAGSAGTLLVDGGTVQASGASSFGGTVSVSGGTLSVADTFKIATLNQSGGALAGTGTVDVAKASTWSDGLESGTGVTNFNGALALTGNVVHDVSERTINFNGTTTWTNTAGNAGRFRTGSAAALNNNGTWLDQTTVDTRFTNDYGGAVATFTNNGTYVKTGATTTTLTGIAYVNNGTTDVQAGVIALPVSFTNPGTLMGAGTFSTSLLTNTGHVAPGDGPGTLALSGNFAQAAAGSLDVQLSSPSSRDLFVVSGSASLGGTLDLICYGDCALAAGQTFTILDAAPNELTGSFDHVVLTGFQTGAFTVVYDRADGDVLLNATLPTSPTSPVPEPAPTALLLAGGLLVAWWRRATAWRRRGRPAR